MKAKTLRAWQARMGFTYDEAAAALGVARSTYGLWLQTGRVSRAVQLACAAIEAGVSPATDETGKNYGDLR